MKLIAIALVNNQLLASTSAIIGAGLVNVVGLIINEHLFDIMSA